VLPLLPPLLPSTRLHMTPRSQLTRSVLSLTVPSTLPREKIAQPPPSTPPSTPL